MTVNEIQIPYGICVKVSGEELFGPEIFLEGSAVAMAKFAREILGEYPDGYLIKGSGDKSHIVRGGHPLCRNGYVERYDWRQDRPKVSMCQQCEQLLETDPQNKRLSLRDQRLIDPHHED